MAIEGHSDVEYIYKMKDIFDTKRCARISEIRDKCNNDNEIYIDA